MLPRKISAVAVAGAGWLADAGRRAWSMYSNVRLFGSSTPRQRPKSAAEYAASVHNYRTLYRLHAQIDRAIGDLTSALGEDGYDRQLELIETLQEAEVIVARTHAWANFGEGYVTSKEEAEAIMDRESPGWREYQPPN